MNRYNSTTLFLLACLIIFSCINVSAHQQDVAADNTSKYIGSGRYNWTVYIVASEDTLNQINYVEYTLHPTFPNPKRRVNQRGSRDYPFALSSNGWGEFNIVVKVVFNNGRVFEFDYRLKLESDRNNKNP